MPEGSIGRTPLLLTISCALYLCPLVLLLFAIPLFRLVALSGDASTQRAHAKAGRVLLVSSLGCLGLAGILGLAGLNGVRGSAMAGGVSLLFAGMTIDLYLVLRIKNLEQKPSTFLTPLLLILVLLNTILHILLLAYLPLSSRALPIIRAMSHAAFDAMIAICFLRDVMLRDTISSMLVSKTREPRIGCVNARFSNPWRPSSPPARLIRSKALWSRCCTLLASPAARLFISSLLSLALCIASAAAPISQSYGSISSTLLQTDILPTFFGTLTSPVAAVLLSLFTLCRFVALAIDALLPCNAAIATTASPPGDAALQVDALNRPYLAHHSKSFHLDESGGQHHTRSLSWATASSSDTYYRQARSHKQSLPPPPPSSSASISSRGKRTKRASKRPTLNLALDGSGTFTPPMLSPASLASRPRTPKRSSAPTAMDIEVEGGDPFARLPSTEAKEEWRKRVASASGEEELDLTRMRSELGSVLEEGGGVSTSDGGRSSDTETITIRTPAPSASGWDGRLTPATLRGAPQSSHSLSAPPSTAYDPLGGLTGIASSSYDPFALPTALVRPPITRAHASAPPASTSVPSSPSSSTFGSFISQKIKGKKVRAKGIGMRESSGSALSFSCAGDSEGEHDVRTAEAKSSYEDLSDERADQPRRLGGPQSLYTPEIAGLDDLDLTTSGSRPSSILSRSAWWPFGSTTPTPSDFPSSPTLPEAQSSASAASASRTPRAMSPYSAVDIIAPSPSFAMNPKRVELTPHTSRGILPTPPDSPPLSAPTHLYTAIDLPLLSPMSLWDDSMFISTVDRSSFSTPTSPQSSRHQPTRTISSSSFSAGHPSSIDTASSSPTSRSFSFGTPTSSASSRAGSLSRLLKQQKVMERERTESMPTSPTTTTSSLGGSPLFETSFGSTGEGSIPCSPVSLGSPIVPDAGRYEESGESAGYEVGCLTHGELGFEATAGLGLRF